MGKQAKVRKERKLAASEEVAVEEATVERAPSKPHTTVTTKQAEPKGFFLRLAEWLLSRTPWFRTHYQTWSHAKRIWIGLPLYLIVLPVIPITIMIALYLRDPDGFLKSPAFKILVALTVAWIGGFGAIAAQTPVTDGQSYASVKEQSDGEKTDATDKPDAVPSKEAKEKVASQTKSKDTKGRKFANCTEAFEAGVFDIKRNNPSYERRLDRDNDGIACEK